MVRCSVLNRFLFLLHILLAHQLALFLSVSYPGVSPISAPLWSFSISKSACPPHTHHPPSTSAPPPVSSVSEEEMPSSLKAYGKPSSHTFPLHCLLDSLLHIFLLKNLVTVMDVCVHTCQDTHVEVRGHFEGTLSTVWVPRWTQVAGFGSKGLYLLSPSLAPLHGLSQTLCFDVSALPLPLNIFSAHPGDI